MKYFIDFEANSPTNEIIEIGCVSEKNDCFKMYVKPTTPIDPFITGLTHITNKMVEDSPLIDEAIMIFYNWLINTQEHFSWKDTTFYCYGNADHSFIQASAQTCETTDSYMILAAMAMSLKDFTKKVNHFFKDNISLIQALNYFKTSETAWEQCHDALDDALALKELYKVLPKKYSLPCSPFVIKTEMGVRRNKKGCGYTDYISLTEATECIVKEILTTSPNSNVKSENIRKRIIHAINKKSSYMGYKWKYVKIEKGEEE